MIEAADIAPDLVRPPWDAARTRAEGEGVSLVGDGLRGDGCVFHTGTGGAA